MKMEEAYFTRLKFQNLAEKVIVLKGTKFCKNLKIADSQSFILIYSSKFKIYVFSIITKPMPNLVLVDLTTLSVFSAVLGRKS